MKNLEEKLKIQSNDYGKLGLFFSKRGGLEIFKKSKDVKITKSCSVIIPFGGNPLFLEKSLNFLINQSFPLDYSKDNIEVILVNDGTHYNLDKIIDRVSKFYNLIYLESENKLGRAMARNLGLIHSSKNIIVFLDADMVVPKNFLTSHLLIHEISDECISVGFRHNITLKNLKKKIPKFVSYKKDFRWKKFIPRVWYNDFPDIPLDNFNKLYYPLIDSDYFKSFGKNRIIGVWSLPFMFLACNVSILRRHLLSVGGFDSRFNVWGLEDTHLGAKLIAQGLYLVPNLESTTYHLVKKNAGKSGERVLEFRKNYELYRIFKKEKIKIFNGKKWIANIKRQFFGKYNIKIFKNETS